MGVEEIQAQACNSNKFPRIGNGRISDASNKLAQHKNHLLLHHYNPHDNDNDDDDNNNENDSQRAAEEIKRPSNALVSAAAAALDAANNNGGGGGGGGNRLRGWHHSSRIIRVSRVSGGKDRHSKVLTSKGQRDRRVRLSVTTAIQFYDLQDRLGYDQPSKAVEWLINAAADAIDKLPSLNTAAFPDTPKQLSDEKRASTAEQGLDSADVELELDHGDDGGFRQQQQQHLSLSKSACSSTSETSKGSGLSLSRSEIRVNRVKARERARERAAKDKERDNPNSTNATMNNMNSISQNSSFTELLTSGFSNANNNNNNNTSSSPTTAPEQQIFFPKPSPAAQMDYSPTGLLGLSSSSSSRPHQHHSSSTTGFPGHIHLGNTFPMSMSMSIPPPFGISIFSSGSDPTETLPSYSLEQHLIPVAAGAPSQPSNGGGSCGDYSLNFSIATSGLAGFNRGTLQSNSSQSSLLPHHLQRLSSAIDGSTNVPFVFGAAAAAAPPMENHHHHQHQHHHQVPAGFDGRLQLCYGDGSRHSDQKGKGKN